MKSISNQPISDQQIDAFVDAQLSAPDRATVLSAMESSRDVSDRVAEARRLKDLVRLAYLDEQPEFVRFAFSPRKYLSHAAAVVFGALTMLLLVEMKGTQANLDPNPDRQAVAASGEAAYFPAATPQPERVLFHLSSGDNEAAQELLDQVELVASHYARDKRDIRVIVITNNEGLRMFTAGSSGQAERIQRLYASYDNIVFAACGTTLGKRIAAGEKTDLLPEIIVVDSGVAEITRRQLQGWKYIRI